MSTTTLTHPMQSTQTGSPASAPQAPRGVSAAPSLLELRLQRLVAGRVGQAARLRSEPSIPFLRDGKPLPGPDEWRAIARRASSVRLRGSGGSIGGC